MHFHYRYDLFLFSLSFFILYRAYPGRELLSAAGSLFLPGGGAGESEGGGGEEGGGEGAAGEEGERAGAGAVQSSGHPAVSYVLDINTWDGIDLSCSIPLTTTCTCVGTDLRCLVPPTYCTNTRDST